ncbi:MAG: FAD-dependent oxidoreductase [Spirochaetaceae bacterium]|nr:FAD-dependent oxidoreductase [Spirochaetaceae bacterium]
MKTWDVAVIGGGPGGLAAAIEAKKTGAETVIFERGDKLGGILNQCIHTGFGLHTFKRELTGPEYAAEFIREAESLQIPVMLNTFVLNIHGESRVITAMNEEEGLFTVKAKSVVLAMGCRERPRGMLNIPGFRPGGIFSAGTAQRLLNVDGLMPGKDVVILGSGDIGLIMARRITLEGGKVHLVAELMPYSGGLKRNIVQCLDDFGIPLLLSHTITQIRGKDRVEGVTLSKVDENFKPIKGTERDIPCDTVLFSCGLIPENEISAECGVKLSPITGGAEVNQFLETNLSGIFACGNVLHVHDLVDFVSSEASVAGKNAGKFALKNQGGENLPQKEIFIHCEKGVRYTVPQKICISRGLEDVTVRFRVGEVRSNCAITLRCGDRVILSKKKKIVSPGEMETLILPKALLEELATTLPFENKITMGLEE